MGFGGGFLNFELLVWLTAEAVKRPGAVQAAYYWALEDALRAHGIEIPFPQRDLHLRSMFGVDKEAAQALWQGHPKPAADGPLDEVPGNAGQRAAGGNDALDDALGGTPGPGE